MPTSFINLCIFYCWRRDERVAFIKCLRDFGRVTCWRSELSLEQQEGHAVDAESPTVSPGGRGVCSVAKALAPEDKWNYWPLQRLHCFISHLTPRHRV